MLTHDEAREAISAAADGELDDDALLAQVEDHLADCAECAAFDSTIRQVRSELRFERLDDIPHLRMPDLPALPDLPVHQDGGDAGSTPVRSLAAAQSVRAARRGGRPLWIAAAAAAVIGLITGAGFAGLGSDPTPDAVADDFGELILQAQHDIRQVDADFTIAESSRGAGERSFTGSLLYAAPESLRLTITEDTAAGTPTTAAPATAPGDFDLVVEDGTWTLDSVRTCETCPDGIERWRQQVEGREPFSEAAPIPLELITAVDGFALAEEPVDLGVRTIAGEQAMGVRVTAAQVSGFLTGLSPARDLRATHPTDVVDIWFERDHLVPLAVDVSAADSAERSEWARIKGYGDRAGDNLLSYEVSAITINAAAEADRASPATPVPPYVQATSEGFLAGEPRVVPEPATLAAGLRPHLAGTVSTVGGPTVGVRTWTDGRAWVKVRATDEWTGNRIFGELGEAAVAVDLDGDTGIAYVASDRGKVALHTDSLDVVVSGSVPTSQLREIAGSLGVVGEPIPDTWSEAATATVDQARDAVPGLLVAEDIDGFAVPGVRIRDGLVVQVYTGPGERGFVLTHSDVSELSPADAKSSGIQVRGQPGRYSFIRGELEWTEDGATYSLSSATLSLAELVTIADRLEPG